MPLAFLTFIIKLYVVEVNSKESRTFLTIVILLSFQEKISQPFAVGIYKSTVFWDDWTVEQVMEADKVFGWGVSPIANFTRNGLVDLKVYGHGSQHGSNICA